MECVQRACMPPKKRERPPLPEPEEDELVTLDHTAAVVGSDVKSGPQQEEEEVPGRVTPVYGGTVVLTASVADEEDGVEAEQVEVVEDDSDEEEEAPVTNEELEGEWKVLSGGTVQIGTVHVRFPPAAAGAGAARGVARFRDVVTQLHTKHAMAPDPDTVLGCGSVEQAKPAPANRPMVVLEADYATSGKFWRVRREHGILVWRKTSVLELDEALGWYRDAHRDDATIREDKFLAWTRELPEDARVVSAKDLEAPKRAKKRGRGWTVRKTHPSWGAR